MCVNNDLKTLSNYLVKFINYIFETNYGVGKKIKILILFQIKNVRYRRGNQK